MTPADEAALAQRRWILLRLAGIGVLLVLAVLVFLFLGPLQVPPVGFTLVGIALVVGIAFPFVANRLANRGLASTSVTAPVSEDARARAAEWNSED